MFRLNAGFALAASLAVLSAQPIFGQSLVVDSADVTLTGSNNYPDGITVNNNTLTVNGGSLGSTASPSGLLTVGQNLGDNGTAEITNGAIVNIGDLFVAGDFQNNGNPSLPCVGLLTINGGSSVTSGAGLIGNDSSGSGTVNVDGAGTTWTIAAGGNDIEVGCTFVGTTGTLNITQGGKVQGAQYMGIGDNGNNGHVTVDGALSSLAMVGPIDMANGPTSVSTLTITNGGSVSTQTGSGPYFTTNYAGGIGDAAGSSATVTVDGADSSWTNSGDLLVGNLGNGTLSVTNGGVVSNQNGSIGDGTGATGAVTVDGPGSTWTNSGSLLVGNAGTGTLTISNGGTVNVGGGTGTVTLGNGAGGTGTLNVGAAAGSPAAAGGILNAATVNTGSGSGTLQFNTSATSASPYYFTSDGTAHGNAAAITGSTQVINTGGVNVLTGANTYTGTTTVNGGTLEIGGGASLQNSSIANNGGSLIVAVGGSVLGVGSFVQSGGSTEIDGTLSGETMNLSGGALLDTGSVTVSGSVLNSGAAIAVDGASASFNVKSAGGTYTQTGGSMITGEGGTFDPAEILIEGGIFGGDGTIVGDVTLDGGTLQVGAGLDIQGDYTQNGGSITFDVSPNGSGGFTESELTFASGSTVSVADANVVLDFIDGSDPTTFNSDGLDNLGTFLASSGFAAGFTGTTISERVVPETPATWILLGAGLIGMAALRRRRCSGPTG